jgi:hypothetical protein
MRFVLPVLAALALTACDSGEVPSPAERQAGDAGSDRAAISSGIVDLRGDGLSAGAEAFYFAAGRSEVEGALARALGAATGSGTNTECGAGKVDFTDFPGGLAAHFQQGRLVGWNWRLPQDGDAAPTGAVRLAGGDIALATARSVVERSSGFAALNTSMLGDEFALGNAVGGFFTGDQVSMLYAGTQCFMR